MQTGRRHAGEKRPDIAAERQTRAVTHEKPTGERGGERQQRHPDGGPEAAGARGSGRLLGVAITDAMSDGLSMVYSFF